jgi:hypothetical protein
LLGRLVRPWHPHSRSRFGCSCSPSWPPTTPPSCGGWAGPQRAVDFRPCTGATILLDGSDPYDDPLLKQGWLDTARREGFTGLSLPGHPLTPLVYPPWALPLFLPFTALPWLVAVPVWYALLAALLVSTVLLLAGLVKDAPRIVAACDLLALALVFKAIDWAALVAQAAFLLPRSRATSWALSARGRDVSAGIALDGGLQVHLVLPFALLAVFRRKQRTLFAAVLTVAVLGGIFVGLCDNPASAVASLADNLTGRRDATYDPQAEGYPLSHKLVWRTSLTALAELFAPGAWRHEIVIDALLLATVVPFWVVPFARRRVSPARAFSIFAVLGLLATPHYHYDCLILLPVYLVARESDRGEQAALWLPVRLFPPDQWSLGAGRPAGCPPLPVLQCPDRPVRPRRGPQLGRPQGGHWQTVGRQPDAGSLPRHPRSRALAFRASPSPAT